MSTEYDIIDLYMRERLYEKSLHGNYKDLSQLSLPSFIIFLRRYLEKMEQAYTENWTNERPEWLISCKEFNECGSAPVKAYEELIKLFTLAGAALETYTEVKAKEWRPNIDGSSKN
jgi:hypothetical protein